jgi:hypothetical protein
MIRTSLRRTTTALLVAAVTAVLGAPAAYATGGAKSPREPSPICGSDSLGPFKFTNLEAIEQGYGDKVIDISYPYYDDGVRAHLWDYHEGTNQVFCLDRPTNVGTPGYHIRAIVSGKCLDLPGPTMDWGSLVHQWTCFGPWYESQAWSFHKTGSYNGEPTYIIKNVYSGLCIDHGAADPYNGQDLMMWSCDVNFYRSNEWIAHDFWAQDPPVSVDW